MSARSHILNPRSVVLMLMAASAASIAGFMSAMLINAMTLAAVLAALALACGSLTMLIATASVAGHEAAMPPRTDLVDQPGKHMVEGACVLSLPEVNP